jgi:hypothetical protein
MRFVGLILITWSCAAGGAFCEDADPPAGRRPDGPATAKVVSLDGND